MCFAYVHLFSERNEDFNPEKIEIFVFGITSERREIPTKFQGTLLNVDPF